jgi:hypothetical protein
MGRYLGSWKLEDIIYPTVQTSSFTLGSAADAESVPTWRMYEDNTTTPVTTGSFTTLNSMAGFYVAAITLAAAIGYEKGKNYSLRVAATVNGVIGADVHNLQIEAEVDSNSVSVTVNANVSSITAGAISAGAITDGAFTSPKFGAGFITAGSITDGALTSPKFGAGFITAGSFSGNALAGMAVTVGATSASAIAVKVWDEPKVGHVTADTYGEYLDATVSGISGGSGDTTVSPTAAAAIAVAVWSETANKYTTAGSMGYLLADAQSLGAITAAIAAAVTANSIGAVTVGATAAAAIANRVTAGSIGAVTVGATSISAAAVAVWDEPKAGHVTADTYGEYLDSTTGAIKAETAAIKAKTDLIFAGTTGSLKCDVKYVNGVSVTGNGQTGTEWGPGT